MAELPEPFVFSAEVAKGRALGQPIVALESAVITHGLPRPENLTLAQDMDKEVRDGGAVPATIAVWQGKVHVGLEAGELEQIANAKGMRKISSRDFAAAIARKGSGGTTVAGTLAVAKTAGIRTLATGGIGGVHRQPDYDVSADLTELARSPVMVVCAGAKAILDLPATLEYLETIGVPVVGYQTDVFPAFYSRGGGLPVSERVETAAEAAAIAKAHWELGMKSAVVLVVPPPEETALSRDEMEEYVAQALEEAEAHGVHGQAVTPFLLQRVSEFSGGESLRANLSLLVNNARVAAEVALHLTEPRGQLA